MSYIYRIEEIIESINSSVLNIEKVIEQQTELCNVINNSESKEYFKEFVEDLKKDTDDKVNQLDKLLKKRQQYDSLLITMKQDVDLDLFATEVFDALGIFGDIEENK